MNDLAALVIKLRGLDGELNKIAASFSKASDKATSFVSQSERGFSDSIAKFSEMRYEIKKLMDWVDSLEVGFDLDSDEAKESFKIMGEMLEDIGNQLKQEIPNLNKMIESITTIDTSDVDGLLAKFRQLEAEVKAANKTGIGDAIGFQSRYAELNAMAHIMGAFKKDKDNSDFNGMANARLGGNIKKYYETVAAQAEQAGKSVEDYNAEVLKSQGLEQQAGESTEEFTQRIYEQAEAAKKAAEAVEAQAEANKKMVKTISSISSAISSVVKGIVNSFKSMISVISGMGNIIKQTVSVIKDGIQRLLTLFGNLGNRVRYTNQHFNILKGTATELRSKILLLTGAFEKLFNNKFINQGQQILSSIYALKTIVGDELTQSMIDWANSMEYAFGLSAEGLIADISELTGVLYGLGMAEKDVVTGSQNLLMISKYLASIGLAGGDAEAAINKIVSGIKGQTESVDDLGLSVREAEMDAYLKKLKAQGGEFANISTSFSGLNEQAKIYVRYSSIIDQFTKKYDITNLENALGSVTGKTLTFKEAVTGLASTIGTGFMNLASIITQYITPVVYMLDGLIAKLFSLIGISTSISIDSNGATESTKDLASGLDSVKESLEGVSSAAADAGSNLQGFDKLNNISSASGAGAGVGGNAFDYSSLMVDALAEFNARAKEIEESFYDTQKQLLKDKLAGIKQTLLGFAADVTGRDNIDLGFNWDKIKSDSSSALGHLKTVFSEIGKITSGFAIKFADDLNIGEVFTNLVTWFESLTELVSTAVRTCQPYIDTFYDEAIKPIADSLGGFLNTKLTESTAKFEEWIQWFEDPTNSDSISGFFERLTNGVNSLQSIWENTMYPMLSDLANWTISDGFPWFADTLERIVKYVDENGDKIRELFTDLAGLAWDSFKVFAEAFAKVIDLAVQHPKAVEAVLGIAITGKVAAPAIKGIDDAVKDITGKGIIGFGAAKIGAKIAASKAAAATAAEAGAAAGAGAATAAGTGAATGTGAAAGGGVGAAIGGVSAATVGIVLAIAAAIVAAIASVKNLWETCEHFRATIKAGWDEIVQAFELAKERLSDAFGRVAEIFSGIGDSLGGLKESFGAFANSKIVQIVKEGFGGLAIVLNTVLSKAISFVINLISKLGQIFGNIIGDILQVLDGLVVAIGGVIDFIIGVITLDGQRIIDGLSELCGGLAEVFLGLLNTILDTVGNIIAGIITGFSDGWDDVITKVTDCFDRLIKAIKDFLGIHSPSTVFADIGKNLINGLWEGVQAVWDDIYTKITDKFHGLVDGIKEIFNGVGTWISDKLSGIADEAKGVAQNIKEKASGAVDGFVDWITGEDNKVKNNNDTVTTPKYAGGRASGGTVQSGQFFMARENGLTELVGNFGGYTGVANNEMIINAMYKAVYSAVIAALSSGTGNKAPITINLGDRQIFTRREVMELVNAIMPYLTSNKFNVANTGFGI